MKVKKPYPNPDQSIKRKIRIRQVKNYCEFCEKMYVPSYKGKCSKNWERIICKSCLINSRREIPKLGIRTNEYISNKLDAEEKRRYNELRNYSNIAIEFGTEVFDLLIYQDKIFNCCLCDEDLYEYASYALLCNTCINQIKEEYPIMNTQIELSILEFISNKLLANKLSNL